MAIKVVSSVLDDNIKIVDDIAKANIKQIGGQSPAGGGGVEVWEHGTKKYDDNTLSAGFIANRSWRVSVDSAGEVTYQRSDDGFATAGTTIYTSLTTCVVPRVSDGSNLVGGFALWTGTPSTLVIENIELNGTLAGT